MCVPAPVPVLAPLKLQHILFATDFSACSQRALPFACAMAQRFGADIHLVHIIAGSADTPLDFGAMLHLDRERAALEMENFVSATALSGTQHRASVERGPVGDVVLALIEQEDVDLIVFGTTGRVGIKTPALGSFAEEVLGLAACPVLAIGPHIATDGGAFALERILYATDFGASSLHALPYALWLAEENEAELTLVHAVHESAAAAPNEIMAAARQQLQELLPQLSAERDHAEILVEHGEPSEIIARVAKEKHADLIIMGAHHVASRTARTQAPWTTASLVISKAHCPVWTTH